MKYVRESLNEAQIEDKDWQRMSDLVLSGKDGASVAKSITNKRKAIARFISGLKLKNNLPKYNQSWKSYLGDFAEFGNKALELGATPEEIQSEFDSTIIPDKYTQKLGDLSQKKLNNRFVGSLSKAILDEGFDITYLPHNGNAITHEGKLAMQENGRKWTIGYKTEINLGDKKVNLVFDAITDEGGGPTYYVIDTSASSNIFNKWGWQRMGVTAFISFVIRILKELKNENH